MWFSAICENKTIHYGQSKVFQEGCFNFAQMKSSADLRINKLSDPAVKSELLGA